MKTCLRTLPLLLPVTLAACGGATPEPRTAADEAQGMALLPVGECTQTETAPGMLAIRPSGLAWTYNITADSTVTCEEQRVFISLAVGSSIVLASFADADGSAAAILGPAFIDGVAEDIRSQDSNATLENTRVAVLGTTGAPANCGTIRWTNADGPLRTETCAAIRTAGGVSHLVLVTVTDTDEEWAALDRPWDALAGEFVDLQALD